MVTVEVKLLWLCICRRKAKRNEFMPLLYILKQMLMAERRKVKEDCCCVMFEQLSASSRHVHEKNFGTFV